MENQYYDDGTLVKNEIEIDLFDAAGSILRRIIIVGLLVVTAFYAGQFYSELFLTPKYQSTAMLYLFTNTFGSNRNTNLYMSYMMSEDYEIIGSTRMLLEEIMEENGISGTVEEIQEGLTLTVLRDSHLLEITLSSTDPEKCRDVTNLLASRIREIVGENAGGVPPTVVTTAVLPRTPYYPNVSRNAKAWAIVTGVVVCMAIVLYDYRFKTIRNEKDVEKMLHLKVLGAIPAERPWWQKALLWLASLGRRRRRKRLRVRA